MNRLDRLIELAQSASPMDRLRIERTIRLIMRARETVFRIQRREQQAWERLTRAKAASQRIREDGTGQVTGLLIMKKDVFQ
jgi:hypothetical protein